MELYRNRWISSGENSCCDRLRGGHFSSSCNWSRSLAQYSVGDNPNITNQELVRPFYARKTVAYLSNLLLHGCFLCLSDLLLTSLVAFLATTLHLNSSNVGRVTRQEERSKGRFNVLSGTGVKKNDLHILGARRAHTNA